MLNFSKVAVENVPPCEIGPVPFSFSQGRRGWDDEQGGSYCVTPLLERRATQNGGGPPAGRVLIGLGRAYVNRIGRGDGGESIYT